MQTFKPDIFVVGGGTGGCAAALVATRAGRSVIMSEESDWIGGQLTSQAVPPDEHGWIEHFGCTATYRAFREHVRAHYRAHYPLRPEIRAHAALNPGNGWVSPLCHEPKVGLSVLHAMLGPQETAGRLSIWRENIPIAVELEGQDRIAAVVMRDLRSGRESRVQARHFIDATENGELLPLAGVEHVTGAEAKSDTGEPDAKPLAEPDNLQAFSVCFVMDYDETRQLVGPPPENYDHWRNYVPKLTPPWPGPWLGWAGLNPRTMQAFDYRFDPAGEPPGPFGGLWGFRRLLDKRLMTDGAFPSDLCLVNWPMIDYIDGHLCHGDRASQSRHIAAAREQSRALFYWLQTEAPRPDGGKGWPGLRLRGDITGTSDGLAKTPYIRESRRIRAEFTIKQQHVAQSCRPGETHAAPFEDSIGVGYYRIDLHPTTGGDNYLDVASLPFQIPLGALIPVRLENLLPAAKNIGTTHITNGCFRLHPVEWNIGEAAGALAAYCEEHDKTPRQVWRQAAERRQFQKHLQTLGVELKWPDKLDLEQGDPHAHASYRYY
jgi:hypothetical protein